MERKEVGKKSWKQVVTSSQTTIEIRGLKKDSSYNFRVIARNSVGCSEPFIIEETFTAAKADIKKSKQKLFTTTFFADFLQLFLLDFFLLSVTKNNKDNLFIGAKQMTK